jgi:hypothetical protein
MNRSRHHHHHNAPPLSFPTRLPPSSLHFPMSSFGRAKRLRDEAAVKAAAAQVSVHFPDKQDETHAFRNKEFFGEMMLEHFRFCMLKKSVSLRKVVEQTREANFPDWTFCDMDPPNGAPYHWRIVESAPVMNDSEYHPDCGRCPASGNTMFNGALTSSPRTPADLVAIMDEWVATAEKLAKHRTDVEVKHRSHAKNAAISTDPMTFRAERDAWMQFTIAAYDVARRHVLHRYKSMTQVSDDMTQLAVSSS